MKNRILIEDIANINEHIGENRNKFDGATILITGCAGFLGFYFLHYFLDRANRFGSGRIIALDNFMLEKPTWLMELKENHSDCLELHKFDIAKDDLANIDGAADADFVVHMASIASPMFYRKYPIETLDANIWGLRHLLDYYKDSERLKGLLFFSSSEIYGDPTPDQIPTSEDYRGNVACVGPRACYDEAKRFGETLCYNWALSYNMPITVARPFNNYGPGMHLGDKRLPADFAQCLFDNKDIVILSDGLPTRTFCYITDAISGYLLCLTHGKFDSFNIGMDKPETSVRDFAELFRQAGEEILGYTGGVSYEKSSDPDYLTDNPNRRCPIIDKARTHIGYDPRILVDEGIRRYIEFLHIERQSA